MSKDIRPAAHILDDIAERGDAVHKAAARLSQEIEKVETSLSKLPGRVEAYTYGSHPDWHPAAPVQLGLRFHRQGKEWIISWGTVIPAPFDENEPIDWKPLGDAPIKIKISAVTMFPDLLLSVEKSQINLVSELEAAVEEASRFVAVLDQRTKGSK